MYRSISVPALHIGKRRSNWLEQAGCQTLQNGSCKNVNARALWGKRHSATAVVLVPQGTPMCQLLSTGRTDAPGNSHCGLTFLTDSSKTLKLFQGSHQQHFANSVASRAKKFKETDSRENIFWPFFFSFFVPNKTDVATKSGFWRL